MRGQGTQYRRFEDTQGRLSEAIAYGLVSVGRKRDLATRLHEHSHSLTGVFSSVTVFSGVHSSLGTLGRRILVDILWSSNA